MSEALGFITNYLTPQIKWTCHIQSFLIREVKLFNTKQWESIWKGILLGWYSEDKIQMSEIV